MRAAAPLWVAVLCVATVSPPRAAPMDAATQLALERCMQVVDESAGVRTEGARVDLASACPQLQEWLLEASMRGDVAIADPTHADRETLADLRLFQGVPDTALERPAPARALLDEVLEGLDLTGAEPPGLWSSFLAWLRGKLATQDGDTQWLDDLIELFSLPPWLAELVLKGTLALLVLLCLLIVGNELRLFGWRRRAAGVDWSTESDRVEGTSMAWSELDALAPREQVSAALALLLERFESTVRGRDRPQAWTHREWLRVLERDRSEAGTALAGATARVFHAAERVLYGDATPSSIEAATLREECRRIAGEHSRHTANGDGRA